MVYKQISEQCDKEVITSDQVVYIISCQGLCTHNKWPYPEFQFTATNFLSMATKLSNLSDKMSEAILQVNGQVEKLTQGAADQWETEGEDSSPHNSLMWSPVQRPLLGHLNMKHCLETLIRLLSLSVNILDKTGTAVNKVKSLLKSWQAFAGFHAEAASSGHWGNVRLTNIIKKTYQDGTAVDLDVDKERGCLG